MWKLSRTETFVRTARRRLKRDPQLQNAFAECLELLESDPNHPRLKLHRLRGQLDGLWAVRVTYRVRIVLALDEEERSIVLLDLGSHDEVYR
jgi:mRNA-degrading endonuclease YafQ of YafQ-DinJ toxin-antitoxin module